MLFNSLEFILLFLPICLGVALQLKGSALLRWITISSFIFYAFAGQLWFLIPMLGTILWDFLLAQHIAVAQGLKKKLLLIASLSGNLGLLLFFKYSGFFAAILLGVLSLWHIHFVLDEYVNAIFKIFLPAGISFYTFQTLSYIIDVYRGKAKPQTDFWLFASFVSFFPHLVAGPLTRHHQLIPSLEAISQKGITPRWREGVYLFTLGIAKKVLIADRIGVIIDPLIGSPNAMSIITAWMSLVGYSLQIYFDFSGYSDMAIGLGRLFGVELPQNFNSPYQAADPSDFWRRWHMTLSAWFRDYLYIPLGGSQCGVFITLFNLMITMFLGGLWHGANWTFAVWGLYHGFLLILYHQLRRWWDCLPIWERRSLTFNLVILGWIPFRAESFGQAKGWFFALMGLNPGVHLKWRWFINTPDHVFLSVLVLGGLGVSFFCRNASSYESFNGLSRRRQFALGLAAVASLLCMNLSSRFLYYQF